MDNNSIPKDPNRSIVVENLRLPNLEFSNNILDLSLLRWSDSINGLKPNYKFNGIMTKKKHKMKDYLENKKSGYIRKTKRSVGPVCRGNCAKLRGTKCSSFTPSDRLKIFDDFWSAKYSKKKKRHEYLNNLIDNSPSENGIPIYNYHLMLENERIRVCREMFLNTLGISIKMLKYPKENCKNVKEISENESIETESVLRMSENNDTDSEIANSNYKNVKEIQGNESIETESILRISENNDTDSEIGDPEYFIDSTDCEKIDTISQIKTTKEIGIQCDLLKELWNEFSYHSKKKFMFFENFLNTSCSGNKFTHTQHENISESEDFFNFPENSGQFFLDSLTENKSSNESVADSSGYQDDADTIETAPTESYSETENCFKPNIRNKKLMNRFNKVGNSFKCLKCNAIFRLKSDILEHLNIHSSCSKNRKDKDKILYKRRYLLHNEKNVRNLTKAQRKRSVGFMRSRNNAKDTINELPKNNIEDSEQSVLNNLMVHAKPNFYKCSCGENFLYHIQLIRHLSNLSCSKHEEVKTIIPISNKNQHKNQFSEPFYCKICDIDFGENKSEKHFSSESHLQKENVWIRKYNIKKFICLECKVDFEMLLELVRHQVKTHQKRISFLFFEHLENFNLKYCYICEKSFVKRINYYDHMNMHKKIYAYACSCGKKFQFHNSLLFHSQKRGCPVEGRILPNYCPNFNSKNIKTKEHNKKETVEENIEFSENDLKETKRIIDITGKISNTTDSSEQAKVHEDENHIINTDLGRDAIVPTQPPIIYLPQMYNNECFQNQVLSIPTNQNNHIIPHQIMPGTVFVYEPINQSNVIQIPQIVNVSDIGQTLQIPIATSNEIIRSTHFQNTNFDAEFNEMITFKNSTSNISAKVISDQTIRTSSALCSNIELQPKEVNNEKYINNQKLDLRDVGEQTYIDSAYSEIETDETNGVNESNDNKDLIHSTKKKKFYCELCRQNYPSSSILKHFKDINHKKLEDEWRKSNNLFKITCPLCPRTTFDKFFGLICHQYKVHGIKVDKLFFKKYKEIFESLNK